MAEIKIEKKKPVWPWILGLIIVAAVIGYFVFMNNDKDDNQVDQSSEVTETVENDSIASATEITQYATYVNDPKMGLDHEYSNGAILRLIDATRATAQALNVDTEVNLNDAKANADEITNDPERLNHADKIKGAAKSITAALKNIQAEKFPQLQSQYNDVEMAVDKIDPAVPALEQKDAINMFYNNAAKLLTDIKNDYGKER